MAHQTRTIFSEMTPEQLEQFISQKQKELSTPEVKFLQNMIYRKRYNATKWGKEKQVKALLIAKLLKK